MPQLQSSIGLASCVFFGSISAIDFWVEGDCQLGFVKLVSGASEWSTTKRRKAKLVISDEEEDLVLEDPSKQGRMTKTEYEDVETHNEGFEYELDQTDILQQITPTKVPQSEEQSQETSEVQLDVLSAAKILPEASRERVKTYDRRRRSTDSSTVSTAGGLFSTAEEILCTDERLAQKLDEEEKAKATARKEQERIDFEKALEQSDTIKRYQTLKKKLVSVAQSTEVYDEFYYENMGWIHIGVRTAEASRSEPIQEQPTEKLKELSEEELKKMLEIIPVEEAKAEALQVKYPIIDWEIHTKGSRKYWKIIRVRNITEAYQGFEDMLIGFDREYLDTLWSLVKRSFQSAEPTEDMERALWVELNRLFEPDKDDVMWKLQRYMHDPLTWRTCMDSCGSDICYLQQRTANLYADRKRLSIVNYSYGIDAKQKVTSRRR
ncbi:hypothetical protein Tco_1311859 [Tanacetum coccineum]